MSVMNRGILALSLGIAFVSAAPAADSGNRPGAVFVMTNAAGKNEILAYQRTPDGRLYDGSRFETGGRGSGGITDPLQSQGSLTLSEDRSLLFAVNSGSGDVSVLQVRRSTLSLLDVVPSGGSEPVAVAQHGSSVYVLNAGGSGSIAVFAWQPNGKLRQIRRSTKFLTAAHSGGSSLSISPDGQFLVVTERVPNNIDTYRINADGTLGDLVKNTSAAPGVFSAEFTPAGVLVVSETGPAGGTNASAISSYSIAADGTLVPLSQSVPTMGAANCWNAVTPDGKFVYASNAGTSNLSGFTIGADGTLAPVGGTLVGNGPDNGTNLDVAISANGKFLYTLNSGTGNIGIFAIQADGSLLSLGDAGDLPPSAGFNGIAAL